MKCNLCGGSIENGICTSCGKKFDEYAESPREQQMSPEVRDSMGGQNQSSGSYRQAVLQGEQLQGGPGMQNGQFQQSAGGPQNGQFQQSAGGPQNSQFQQTPGGWQSQQGSNAGFPPSGGKPPKKKLTQRTWFIILWLIIFFPAGLCMMWKNPGWKTAIKVIVTVIIAAVFAFNCLMAHFIYQEFRAEMNDLQSEEPADSDDADSDTDAEEESESSYSNVDPEFKAAMDSYEDFFDEYIEFMEKYSDSDDSIEMLSDYSDYLQKYSDMMDKMEDIDEDELNAAELAYYTKVTARIYDKLADAGL